MGLAAAIAACVLCLLAPPAGAAWEEVGATIRQADPGFSSFDVKRIGGRLYNAVTDAHNVYLYRLDDYGYWEFLDRVNERPAGDPSLAEGPDGVPWLAWVEDNADGVAQVRAGWLDPSGHYFHEPDPRDWSINYRNPEYPEPGLYFAAEPKLVFLGDRPYITFLNDNGVDWTLQVVRLTEAGNAWERIGSGLLSSIPHNPDAAVVDGLLNIGLTDGWDFAAAGRLSQAGQWEDFGEANESIQDSDGYDVWGPFDGIAGFGGEAHVLWSTEGYDDYTTNEVIVSKRVNGAWQVVGGPVASDAWGRSIRQIGGRLYAAWIDSRNSPELHVSRLADDGSSWTEVGGPVGHPVSGGAVLVGVDGVPYIEFTESNGHGATVKVMRLVGAPASIGPDETGSGPGEDPPVEGKLILPPRGGPKPPDPPDDPDPPVVHDVCGPRIAGTRHADRIAGTATADTIRGLGGDDTLSGGRAFDCLFGGLGEDRLSGGAGNDRLDGGADEDVLAGGPGGDRLRGGAGWDDFSGGRGDDTIDAADGRGESVRCGRGHDTVRADRFDRLRGCERVKVAH